MAHNPPFRPHLLPDGAQATKELLKYVPQLSLKERDRRWDGIRKKMLLANIDVLLFMGLDVFWDMGMINLRYVTQVGSKMGAHALFFVDREPIIWNALPHMNRPTNMAMSTQEWVSNFRPYAGVADVAAAVRESGFNSGRIGLVSFGNTIVTTPTTFHGDVLAYQKELPAFQFVDANWVVEQMRLIKNEEEIAMLAKAGALARKTVDTLIEYSRPGVTEAALYAELIKTQVANGGEPQIFHLLSSDRSSIRSKSCGTCCTVPNSRLCRRCVRCRTATSSSPSSTRSMAATSRQPSSPCTSARRRPRSF